MPPLGHIYYRETILRICISQQSTEMLMYFVLFFGFFNKNKTSFFVKNCLNSAFAIPRDQRNSTIKKKGMNPGTRVHYKLFSGNSRRIFSVIKCYF